MAQHQRGTVPTNERKCFRQMFILHAFRILLRIEGFTKVLREGLFIFKCTGSLFVSMTTVSLYVIDDYAKDGGPGESDLEVVFTMILCATNFFIW